VSVSEGLATNKQHPRSTPRRRKPNASGPPCKAEARSKLTNGVQVLPNPNKRGLRWARRFRDLIQLHLSDLGGEQAASEGELALVRRVAALIVELELMEARFASLPDGESPASSTFDLYQRAVNSLRRTLLSLGLRRRPRDITPTLDEYTASKRQIDADDLEEVNEEVDA